MVITTKQYPNTWKRGYSGQIFSLVIYNIYDAYQLRESLDPLSCYRCTWCNLVRWPLNLSLCIHYQPDNLHKSSKISFWHLDGEGIKALNKRLMQPVLLFFIVTSWYKTSYPWFVLWWQPCLSFYCRHICIGYKDLCSPTYPPHFGNAHYHCNLNIWIYGHLSYNL